MTLKADSRSLPFLHDDVVLEIFKFLSVSERKNARLVCRQWHRVSNQRIFAEREAFFVSNMYKICTVVEVLVKCERKILNLKFYQGLIGPSSNILWQECGQRIQSLQFRECIFIPDIIERIFINCENLTEFSTLGGSVGVYDPIAETLPRRKSLLQINDDVVKPKLRTLCLESYNQPLRECDLRLISSVFPQLKSLKIEFLLSEEEEICDSPNFTILLNLIGSGLKNLETLDMRFMDAFEFEPTDFTSVPHINLNRLKNVSMSLEPFILEGNSLTQILNYKFWRSFRIDCHHSHSPTCDITVITRLVNENPLLEKLEVYVTCTTTSEFSDLFKALVQSRLKSLKIGPRLRDMSLEEANLFVAEVTSLLEGLPCNDTVECLYVDSDRTAEFTSLFVKYFRNIRDLVALPGNVNTIFEYQTNLTSLTIQPAGAIRTDKPPARKSIESLEFLALRPLILDVFTAYQFPNLKYLVITDLEGNYGSAREYDGGEELLFEPAFPNANEENGDDEVNQNDLERKMITDTNIFIRKMNTLMSSIFRKSSRLEAIEYHCNYKLRAQAFHVFFRSCLHFHQLRYVSFFSDSPQIDEMELKREVEKYFKKCPSFRGLWFRARKFSLDFYFNIVTNKYEFVDELYKRTVSLYTEFMNFEVNLSEYWRYKR